MTDYNNNADGALDWDDEISDGDEFIILPDGDYPFTARGFERGRHAGSANLPPCNKAIVTVEIDGGDKGKVTIKHNLFLHSKTQGLIANFFRSIGAKNRGDNVAMDWSLVSGATGRCKVGHYISKANGEKYNQIAKFYDPKPSKEPNPF